VNAFYRYGGVATYNGGGNDDYYSGNSYSQGKTNNNITNVKYYIKNYKFPSFFLENSQSGGGRGWKNYNTGGSSGPSKPTGNQGSRYGGRNAPYTRQK